MIQGKGEYCTFSGAVSTVWIYKRDEDDETIDSIAIHIRKWDSNEWQCPYARNNEKKYVHPNGCDCPCDKWKMVVVE